MDVVAEVVAWVKSRDLVHDTADHARPRPTPPARRSACCPSARTARWSWSRTARPVGVVTEADCQGVDRFTQLRQVMSTELLTLPAGTDPEQAFGLLHDGRHRLAPVVDAAGRCVGILTRTGALRATLYQPATDAAGGCGSRPRSASTATSRPRPSCCSTPGSTCWWWTPRTAIRRRCSARCARSRDAGLGGAGGRRATWSPPRACADLVEAGADIVKVGRRARRDVHHPDDDRGGPAAVQRGAGVRRRGAAAGRARLGRRRRPAPAGRRAGAGRGRGQRHDRLLVRRHLRVARRRVPRRRRPAVQGELRHGLGPGGAAARRRPTRRSTGPARSCSRRASPPPGCTWTRSAPAWRT